MKETEDITKQLKDDDKWLARLSSSGGVRSYDNKDINKTVEVMRSPDSSGIQYWIGRISDGKEISHSKGLDNLKKKI